jgi:hypothetical protein
MGKRGEIKAREAVKAVKRYADKGREALCVKREALCVKRGGGWKWSVLFSAAPISYSL